MTENGQKYHPLHADRQNIDDSQPPANGPASVWGTLGMLASRLKAITGRSTWRDEPPTNLTEAHAHQQNKENPHNTTRAQLGAAAQTALDSHTAARDNPHGVTAAQAGARPATWVPGWNDVTSKPSTYPPSTHTHDYAPSSHVGSGGSAHANAVAGGASGFITGESQAKLDALEVGGAEAFSGGDIPGPFSVNSPDFVVGEDGYVGVGRSSPAHKLDIFQTGGQRRALSAVQTFEAGESRTNLSPMRLTVNDHDPLAADFSMASWGVHSVTQAGSPEAAAGGNLHAFSATMNIDYLASVAGDNEMAAFYANVKESTPAGTPHSRLWMADLKMHGAFEQQKVLTGVVTFMNNYYDGSPSEFPSAVYTAATNYNQAGQDSLEHAGLPTYPIDRGMYIGGLTGDSADATKPGFKVGLRIGGPMGNWGGARGHVGKVETGLQISDYTSQAIRVGAGSGPAFVTDSQPILAGRDGAQFPASLLELRGAAEPLMSINGPADARVSVNFGNDSGVARWFAAGSAGEFFSGTNAGDTGYSIRSAAKSYHIGGTQKVLSVSRENTLGFFGAPPVARQSGGSATAASTYGTKEQNMLQNVYTAMRNYGLLG